ncbi:MAG TPA: polysaccharide deacetylase family protein [Xanthobacteraceae bacterium]|nr:polysaccharide deacetylase family protein [Xanthobacteraceae bacterium]
MRLTSLCGILAAGLFACPALAEDCPGNPDALGTSRTIVVDPAKMPRIGTMSYPQTLPLEPKEVVLTFDDGPQPKYTQQVLATLEHECVKATFFIIGSLAKEYPDWVQREARAGHTIGNHSETHPRYIDKLPVDRGIAEIDTAARHIEEALAPTEYKMAPFFRFPGFRHTDALDQYVNKQGYVAVGADFPADDWTFIGPETVLKRALDRLEHRGSGILLLHDIHQRTATIVPKLLRELKARGYKIVHMVPAPGTEMSLPPATAAAPGAPSSPVEAASKEPSPSEPAAKTALKEAPKETTSKIAPAGPQAAEPQHRHTASLRHVHYVTRHAAVAKTNFIPRNLRDSPD